MSISHLFPEEGPTLNLNFAGSRTLDPRITFSRTSTGTYMDANGLIVTAPADAPRFDHRYVNGEIESLGLLVEEQRSNLVTYSSDMSQWTSNGGSFASDDTTAPDGTLTADKLTESSGAFNGRYNGGTITLSANTTYSVASFIKPVDQPTTRFGIYSGSEWYAFVDTNWDANGNPTTDDSSGASNVKYEPYPNGWYRASFTFTTPSSVSEFQQYHHHPDRTGSGKSAWFWGAQLEAGAFPTSYIPTSGSTATRNHDRAYYENVDQTEWFNKTEGTVVFEHTDVPYSATTPPGYPAVGFARTSDGDSQTSIQYFISKSGPAAQYLVRTKSAGDSANISIYGTGNDGGKVGFVYKENDYALSKDGEIEGTDTSGAVPDAYMLIFGMNRVTNPTNNWNAHLKNLQYYPTRLTNTQLQNLTK
jgi:hypothetical protein